MDINLQIDESSGTSTLVWHGEAIDGHVFHGFRWRTSSNPEDMCAPTSIILRAMCHLLLDAIPDTGLAEVSESLNEFAEYYRLPVTNVPQLERTAMKAASTVTRDRPEFRIDDEG